MIKKFLPSTAYNWDNYKDAEYFKEIGVPHYGCDFKANCGSNVIAPISGELYRVPTTSGWASNTNGAGYYALALYGDDGTLHLFAHLESNIIDYNDGYGGIKNGSKVQAGQVIGKVGNLGFSKGCHLHWQVLTKHINEAFDVGYYPFQSGVDLTINPMEWYNKKEKPKWDTRVRSF